jgi:hypothetical protein
MIAFDLISQGRDAFEEAFQPGAGGLKQAQELAP